MLAVYGIVNLNINVTEWLIPITIFITALYNIFTAGKSVHRWPYLIYGIILFFGLIHGLGFANAFKDLVSPNESTFLSIIEFAIFIPSLSIPPAPSIIDCIASAIAICIVSKTG